MSAKLRILEKAISLSNQSGLDALSMNEIAGLLGIRTPSLYAHVQGLDDVKRMLALHGLAELNARATEATVGKSGADAIRELLTAYRAFARRNPGVYAALVPTPPNSDREWKAALDRVIATFVSALSGFGLRGDDLVHALRGLRSLAHGFVTLEASGALKNPVGRDESYAWLTDAYVAALDKMSERTKQEQLA